MAEFLSPAWIDELREAALRAAAPAELTLVLQQVVVDDAGHEVASYAVRIADGRVSVEPGRAADADVSLTAGRAVAGAIARGELSAQRAFLDGQLRVGGDLTRVLDASRQVPALGDVFGPARAGTTW